MIRQFEGFFFSFFLFLFPSVNCFSTLFFSENHFLLTMDSIQRLHPSLPRQQFCVLGRGQCSHSGPFPSSSAKALLLHLPTANKKAEFPQHEESSPLPPDHTVPHRNEPSLWGPLSSSRAALLPSHVPRAASSVPGLRTSLGWIEIQAQMPSKATWF